MRLKDQVAIVTGGGRGIGKVIALALASEGADVVLAGTEGSGLTATAEEIRNLQRRPLAFPVDVSREESVAAMVKATLDAFGRIDLLVNNAAITGPTALAAYVSRKDWDEVLAVNLTGPFLCSKAVLRPMMEKRRGKIINIASIAGKIAYPLRSPYAASKWGLIGFTRTLAKEVGAYNIQVNAICPGPVSGERMRQIILDRAKELGAPYEAVERDYIEATALKRMVQARDVAGMVVFLASDDANNITGQAIDVDAGYNL